MWKTWAGTAGVASIVLFAGNVVALPNASAQDQPSMPEIKDMTLDETTAAVLAAAGDPDLVVHTGNIKGPEKPLVEKNWKVCWQAPDAGEPLSEDVWVGVGVAKAYLECWS